MKRIVVVGLNGFGTLARSVIGAVGMSPTPSATPTGSLPASGSPSPSPSTVRVTKLSNSGAVAVMLSGALIPSELAVRLRVPEIDATRLIDAPVDTCPGPSPYSTSQGTASSLPPSIP